MKYLRYFLLYLSTLAIHISIDLVWLGIISKGFYAKHLSDFLQARINWLAVLFLYIFYVLGILIFAVQPAIEKNSLSIAILFGVLFGFFTYMTYDLTNLATLKDWPIEVVVLDVLWGMILSGTVTCLSYFIAKLLKI
ncbi:DUF2177 family protein [Candidatus Dojkabacteria bacterium]|nr:DUF2177 family protein [Candidatus Dojkabacteria bacterium]